jgi:hypothetical protein
MPDAIIVFVSYSHQDATYLERDSLLGFLKGLERDHIELWTDRTIRPGELWDEVIKTTIQNADIALVLVSQGFLDSEYCQNVEIRNFEEIRAVYGQGPEAVIALVEQLYAPIAQQQEQIAPLQRWVKEPEDCLATVQSLHRYSLFPVAGNYCALQ